MDRFYLGAHMPYWAGAESPLWYGEGAPLPAPVPLCISRVRLAGRKTLPRAVCPVLLDSGGFSILSKQQQVEVFADWDLTPRQFIGQVRRICEEMGNIDAVAPMDWMCEPPIIANTGLTVTEHLKRSVGSFLELRWLAPDLKIFPVLQGDASLNPDDHLRCADMYERAGVDLTAEPLVGVGSICRLQRTDQIIDLFAALYRRYGDSVRWHGFGVKTTGLGACAPGIPSADSLGWGFRGMHVKPCRHGLGLASESNCPHFAAEWRANVLAAAARTTLQEWERVAASRTLQDDLFEVPELPGPNMPTFGESLERAVRVLLPGSSGLAAALDTFRRNL
jgi:hypothetical protein